MFAPEAASELMYGAAGLPRISPDEWFSRINITTWSGRGTVVTDARAAGTAMMVPAKRAGLARPTTANLRSSISVPCSLAPVRPR